MIQETLAPIARDSLRSRVYERLLQAIVTGELEPGARLRDQDLASQLGVSRTPVREALQRLEEEGLVETRRGSLTRVMPLDTRAARDTFPVVAALHALATRIGTPHMSAEDVDTLRAANRDLEHALASHDVMRAIAADDGFHRRVVERSGNTEVGPTLDRLMSKIRRLEVAQFGSLAGLRSVEQHDAIIAAVERHDATLAAQRVEENWLSLGALILASFRQPDQPGD
jgi:DNA-binding GntR family transcriptional regulator